MIRSPRSGLAVIAAMWLAALAAFGELPERIPIHWNVAGEPDGWAPRWLGAFWLPALGVGVWLLFPVIPRADPRRVSFERFRPTYELIANLSLLFQLGILGLGLTTALGWPVNMGRGAPLLLGLLCSGMGNELPRFRPNYFTGLRTPWTLESDEVWRATHRLGGRTLVAAGLISTAVALLLPPSLATPVSVAAVVVAGLAPMVYSYLLWRREQGTRSRGF